MLSSAATLAFGFSSGWMLAWLAAAAVPLLLHLWNRRNHRETRWAAMEYLLAALSKSSRRMRIEHWLLLAVRTVLVVLVVTAVAGPYLQKAIGNFAPGQPAHKVLVIDGSYSMAYQPAEKSRFERARQLAIQMVEESSQGDAFSVVLMSAPPRVIIGEPSLDTQAVKDELQSLNLIHGGADLSRTLDEAQRIVQQAVEQNPRLVRREVYFFTDLGRTTWEAAEESAAAQIAGQASELGQLASLAVIDLGQAEAENAAVSSLRVLEPYVTVTKEMNVEATIKNFGQQPFDGTVHFLFDGQPVQQQRVEISPGQQNTVLFRHQSATAGNHTIEARLQNDDLSVDNHRWASIDVKQALRVLCVNGNAATGGFRGETDYLVVALQPDTGSAAQAAIRPEVITESRLSEITLDAYDCVILSNVGQFTAEEAKILESYCKRGGGLIFFLGDRVLPERYNEVVGPASKTQLLAAAIEEPYSGSDLRFDPLDFRHPIVKPFEGNPRAGLLLEQVFKYWRLRLPKESSGQLALAFEGSGDPGIIDQVLHNGRSIVVAFPASLASVDPVTQEPWTVMPKLPAFVPLVQELVAHAVRLRMGEQNFMVGEALQARYSGLEQTISLRTPSGVAQQVRSTSEGGLSRWTYNDTAQSGLYHAQRADQRTALAVNVDTGESDLSKLDAADLPEAFHALANWQDTAEMPPAEIGLSQTVHKWFLYVVLGLLFVESSLAWFFGFRAS